MGALGLPLLALLFGARAGAPTLCEDCKYLSLELEAVLASSARSAEVLDSGRCPLQRLASAIGTPGLLRGRRIWPRRWRVSCEVMLECYEEPLEDWYFQHQKRLLRKFLCEGHVPGARDVACLDEVWTRSKGDHGNQEEEEDTDTARSMTPASSEQVGGGKRRWQHPVRGIEEARLYVTSEEDECPPPRTVPLVCGLRCWARPSWRRIQTPTTLSPWTSSGLVP
ncbi:canopy-like protein 4 isoform B [Alligator mississippiensis]|uniref:Canopy-like protein 4 isoform B n=1 Tax=Alligator mississippiensis TaxID=8496 RepID=A0A151MCK3_ALLMI|nr:canopy-like protein 4 isoform B [Alligator mississippiensis]